MSSVNAHEFPAGSERWIEARPGVDVCDLAIRVGPASSTISGSGQACPKSRLKRNHGIRAKDHRVRLARPTQLRSLSAAH